VAGIGIDETITVETALNGLLLSSGNEIACMLALNVAKKYANQSDMNYEEAEKVFAELMNKKAKDLGAQHSNFVNPHGYHDDNHYTTATDLAIIAKAFLDNNLLAGIVSKDYFNGMGADKQSYPDKKILSYKWKNSNLLISSAAYKYEYATGLKTGSTDEAGKCLVASATKEGKKLLVVILKDSEAGRWRDAANLFNYAFDYCDTATLEKKGDVIDSVLIRDNSFSSNNTIDILADEDIKSFVDKDELNSITKEVKYYSEVATSADGQPSRIALPLKKGQAIGKVYYKINGEVVYQAEVKALEDYAMNLTDNDYTYAHDKMQKVSMIKSLKIVCVVILIAVLVFVFLGGIRKMVIKRRRRTRLSMKRTRKNMYR
jgi:D-alanyl-D-alanine carboxypeptidase (penicillin-binding protein 5/6)